jgi:hypothetical protein
MKQVFDVRKIIVNEEPTVSIQISRDEELY